jgi:heptosyltransferase-2
MTSVFGDIVRAAGVCVPEEPRLAVPRDAAAGGRVAARLARELSGSGPLVVLHPGSGDNFPGRRWPAERFAALGAALASETGARLVVTGGDRERALVRDVARRLRAADPHAAVLELAGELTVIELIELIARAALLVTNDTAPVHIAGALDVAMVALYGPNTPLLYGPVHARGRAIYHALPCSPCLTNMNMKSSSCRLPACVLGIEVDEVLREARRLLAPARRSGRAAERPTGAR